MFRDIKINKKSFVLNTEVVEMLNAHHWSLYFLHTLNISEALLTAVSGGSTKCHMTFCHNKTVRIKLCILYKSFI